MKIELNRIILLAVCSLSTLVFANESSGQLHSILNVQEDAAANATQSETLVVPKVTIQSAPIRPNLNDVARLDVIDKTVVANKPVQETVARSNRVMQANQPSQLQDTRNYIPPVPTSPAQLVKFPSSQHSATPSTTTTETLPAAPMVSIVQLDAAQLGTSIEPSTTVFEIQNLGAVAARDVSVELQVAAPATIQSVVPSSSITESRTARVQLKTLAAGAAKRVFIRSTAPNQAPVQYTARLVMETVQSFGTVPTTPPASQVSTVPQSNVPMSTSNSIQPKFTTDIGYEKAVAVPQQHQPAYPPSDSNWPAAQSPTSKVETGSLQDAVIISVESSEHFMAGSPYKIYATVENPTDMTINDLQVVMKNSDHLKTLPGFAEVQSAPQLGPHHTAKFEFAVYGVEPGKADLTFEAVGVLANTKSESESDNEYNKVQMSISQVVDVFRPSVRGDFQGPKMAHVGTESEYSIELINETGVELPLTDVLLSVPNGLLVTVLDRIAHKRGNEQINWKVKGLQAGESEVIRFKARAIQSGMQIQEINIAINDQVFANGTCQTNVMEPSKMKVEVNNPQQAVAIGEVTNVGLKIQNMNDYDSEVTVSVQLPAGVDALQSDQILSDEKGRVVFKTFMITRMTETQIEFPVVGTTVGKKPVQVSVKSATTESVCQAKKSLLFINPQQEIATTPARVFPIEQKKKPRIVGQRSSYIDYGQKR